MAWRIQRLLLNYFSHEVFTQKETSEVTVCPEASVKQNILRKPPMIK